MQCYPHVFKVCVSAFKHPLRICIHVNVSALIFLDNICQFHKETVAVPPLAG